VGETKSEPPKIKVVDRRKFTVEGDPLVTPAPAAEAAAPAAAPPEDSAVEPNAPIPEPDPVTPPTESRGQPSQLFLELVTMLEEKTAGNLSDEEAKVMSSVLYQLRTFFLQRK
jgi:hypothetical protein